MAKTKKRKLERKTQRRTNSDAGGGLGRFKAVIKHNPSPPHTKPIVPFELEDRILLVGEGDFSFAHSLVAHHGCTSVLATCHESDAKLYEKYPQAKEYVAYLRKEGQKVLCEIDAKKLDRKEIKRAPKFDRVMFNFPHVGGLTKDVNRQVRHNQELLVGFFKAALPLVAPRGTIIVTIFEGQPYTLWNVRDLARHVGLKVGRSFKFQSSAYPGYRHSRTLGNIEGGGAWQGETRSARSFVFEVNHGGDEAPCSSSKRKRKGHASSSDDED